ncbi:MAG: tRNA (guanosine(37)-N1)-methyltransferase TrmD [Candidatus Kerfeldbacteria bacterium]|nr:tRNA (guanosine(37)-N1)-methyltransferase TrmD [Candidatus Kerfeldbacteria bacterium]
MRFDVVTIFPDLVEGYFNESILKRARAKGTLDLRVWNPRDLTSDRHHTVDDRPFGGGPGMLMKAEPIVKTLEKILGKAADKKRRPKATKVFTMDPGGQQFSQSAARAMAKLKHVVLICGRYEGIDARVEKWIDGKISIGPYVLTGGEIPAVIVVDVVSRMVPGVLGHKDSASDETDIEAGFVEYPQYTRPEVFRKLKVPPILLSGDHKKIAVWRTQQRKRAT